MNSKVFYKYSQAKNIALVWLFAHSRSSLAGFAHSHLQHSLGLDIIKSSSLAGFAHSHLHDLVTKSMANARWPWLRA